MKKMIVCLMCVFGLLCVTVNVNAGQTKNWSCGKNVASDINTYTNVTMTYYVGNYYYEATSLYTDGAYIAGTCKGYTIKIIDVIDDDNCIKVSKINKPVSFQIYELPGFSTVTFKCEMEHDATYYQTASASGTVSY